MGLLKKLFTNCACPQGRMGRAMLKFMNLCHAPLTNWGLKLINIQDGWTMLDIGCGGGATLQRLLRRSKDVKVYGIDISEESVAKARKVNADVLDKQVFVTQVNAGKIAEITGIDRKEVDKAFAELKKEGAIVSPVRCKWQPAK